MKIIWIDLALEDLDGFYNYILKDSKANAKKFAKDVFDAVSDLKKFPKKGRIIPEVNDSAYREIFISQIRLFYKLEGSDIYIIGLIHMSSSFKFQKFSL